MKNFKSKKTLGYLSDINEKKSKVAWQLNLGVMLIVVLSISVVGIISFKMISDSILNSAKLSSIQLVKQTSKNIETILSNLDSLSITMLKDNNFSELVYKLNNTEDEHDREKYTRKIESILNTYAVNRSDLADIAVYTSSKKYITSGAARPPVSRDVSSYYVLKQTIAKGKDSVWIDTHVSDVETTHGTAGAYGQVFSLVKSIYTQKSKDSQGFLLINYKEANLYNLISDINVSDNGSIYILGNNGNFVMNQYDRAINNHFAEFKFFHYLRGQLKQGYGSFNTKIHEEDYIVSFNLIKEINGIDLDWIVVLLTPVRPITTGITRAGAQLFFVGLGVLVLGFIFSILIIRRYNLIVDKKYSEKHSVLMEQERLASLGQLIGGIAHNFKTPIMSIAGGLEALKDLAVEYDSSIDEVSVTESDHRAIAQEMKDWVKRIRPYCSYMSDIISAVKGQVVNCNESSQESFLVGDLIKRVEILMSHELKQFHCKMCIDLRVYEDTEVKGEINNLVQVLNNLISNSIEAYNGKPGKIDLLFDKKGDKLEIIVRDYGSGIPEKVKNKLLKEMITTKGAKGTGIGLYMSYSTIKGKFGGTINIESIEGRGTSITIAIPI